MAATRSARRYDERPATAVPLERFEKRRRGIHVDAAVREGAAVFLVAFVPYAVLGHRLVVKQHLIVFDAMARLSHAFDVWYNQPPKLAAVGFVWPPVSTLVFLPLAAVKPLATSLAALPLTSAFFGAALLVVLDAVLKLGEISARFRYPMLALFAFNPMILFYATNGMSEIVYLFFLVYAVYALLRWFLGREYRFLLLASLSFGIGILSRYEVITWAVAVVAVVVVASIRQHVSRDELEGTLVAYLVPISYGLGLWLFVNWLLLKDPFFWLHYQTPGAATQAPQTAPAQGVGHAMGLIGAFGQLIALNWRLFPPVLLVLIALIASFVLRRDLMALTLAVFLSLNAALTALLLAVSGNLGFLQLRYNMRAMPLALVGIAWLNLVLRGNPRARRLLGVVSIVVLLASLPVTWQTMKTYPYQFEEQAFTRALATGEDQEGTRSKGGYVVGDLPERQMADYVVAHVDRRSSILTDDAQSFPILLLSGRPDLFFDRIDLGDAGWLDVRNSPWGRVQYVLVSRVALNDLVLLRFPGLLKGLEPGMTLVHTTSRWALYRVAKQQPRPSASRGS